MKQLVLFTLILCAASAVTAASVQPKKLAECEIVCIEKTPECYVTQDKDGCLDISDKKPVKKDGALICTLKGCETKTKY
jgi:hypothetical protein